MDRIQGIDVFNEQIRNNLIKGSTGCKFAEIIAKQDRAEKINWKKEFCCQDIQELIQENQLHQQILNILSSNESVSPELYSITFPRIKNAADLAILTAFLASQEPFFIEGFNYQGPLFSTDNLNTNETRYTGVSLRYRLKDGKIGRPLIMGDYSFFAPCRKQPYTTLVLRPAFIHNKPTTKPEVIGIDQVNTGITNLENWTRIREATQKGVAKQSYGYNREFFSSKCAVILPTEIWQQAQKLFTIQVEEEIRQ
jgi:hypothetical protein